VAAIQKGRGHTGALTNGIADLICQCEIQPNQVEENNCDGLSAVVQH
jgi:hypothetical protein